VELTATHPTIATAIQVARLSSRRITVSSIGCMENDTTSNLILARRMPIEGLHCYKADEPPTTRRL
jgi:hypothetical protein